MLFIGVDPGSKGAIAAIDIDRNILLLSDLPWWDDGRHDPHALTAFLDNLPEDEFFSVLENSTARVPNAKSMMKLGKSFGSVSSILDLRSKYFLTPYADDWKEQIGVTADKKTSQAMAATLFGTNPKLRADQAEALLLAEFGRRVHCKQ